MNTGPGVGDYKVTKEIENHSTQQKGNCPEKQKH